MAKVLIVGVYLADKPNTIKHIYDQFEASSRHQVEQRWVAINAANSESVIIPNTYLVLDSPLPKFTIINQLTLDAMDFDWIIIADDDIEMDDGFLDNYIALCEQFDFALSQPSRTSDSYIDHSFVEQMPGIDARRTRFVEIGPLVCVRRDAMALLMPFDSDVGMGWGLDFIWPLLIEGANLRMGIVDAIPIAHRLRPPVSVYSRANANKQMSLLLSKKKYLLTREAFKILEVYHR